ncbi:hypothetical protein KH5_12310 [Urechidicola sp. KH5]
MKIVKLNTILFYILLFPLVLTAQDELNSKKPIPIDKVGVHNSNLRIDGFYYQRKSKIKSKNDTIRYISPIIFFKNGAVFPFDYIGNSSMTLRFKKGKKKCKLKPKQNFDTIINFFKCYSEIINSRDKYPIYSVDGNVIRIQSFRNGLIYERQGMVINDSTFVMYKSINYLNNTVKNDKSIYKFQLSKKPDSTIIKPNYHVKQYFKD